MISTITGIVFLMLLGIIVLYSLSQLNLLLHIKKNTPGSVADVLHHDLPHVTVQLPVYNESPVMVRLLRNIANLDYPLEKLEIQVLDDSTDDSISLTAGIIQELQAEGLNINHIKRTHRSGYKAGALKAGLETAQGEYIAVFDADFLPDPRWIRKTLPYFHDPQVGVVQTRWGHLNRNFSLLTKLQGFLLDFHFLFEQRARSAARYFINFNGTAGIWRKKCILDSGNWAGDTLTEDLDLSYRAQIRGWKICYLEHVVTPAELPVTIEAAKSQQFRWNKGAAENFQKNVRVLLKHPKLSVGVKLQALFHLLNSSLFLIVFLLALLSVPLLILEEMADFKVAQISFSFCALVFYLCYWRSYSSVQGKSITSFLKYPLYFFLFFSIAMGLSLNNAIAVLEGHFRKKSSFVRTPKFNITEGKVFKPAAPRSPINLQVISEFLLMLLFGFGFFWGLLEGNYNLVLFHLMLFTGFAYISVGSMTSFFQGRKHA